jgi:hypothetical protein
VAQGCFDPRHKFGLYDSIEKIDNKFDKIVRDFEN